MKIARLLFRVFFTGVFTLLPFIVTAALVAWLSGFLKSYLGPETIVGKALQSIGGTYLLGWVIALGVIFVVGVLMEIALKKIWARCVDNQVRKIPLVGQVYGTARQFTDLMKSGGDDAMKHMKPVFCRYSGALFLALMPVGDEFIVQGRGYRIVMIPTAPLPLSGTLQLLPTEDVFEANISIDALMAFYVSMGASTGDFLPKGE